MSSDFPTPDATSEAPVFHPDGGLLRERSVAIASLGRFALRTTDLEMLFDEAVGVLASTLELELTKVLELLPDGRLKLVAGIGWDDGLVGNASVPGGRDSQAGYTLGSRHAVVVPDLARETRFHGPALLLDHGVACGMSVIIGSDAAPWGVLGVHSRRKRSFHDADIHFLEAVAHILAEAIHRHRSEQEVRDSEHRLRLVADAMPVLIAYCDAEHVYRYCNDRYHEWFGLRKDEVIGHHIREVIGGEAYSAVEPSIRRVMTGERVSFEKRLAYRHGPPRDVHIEYLPHLGEHGRVSGFYAMISDISDRVRANSSNARLAAIVEHSHDAIIGKDLEGTVTSWNAAAERMYGYSAGEIVGRSILTLFPEGHDDELREILTHIRKGESVQAKETVRVRKDGTPIDVLVSVSPIRAKDGEILGASAIAHDLSKFKRAEKARAYSEERLQLAKEAAEIGVFDWDVGSDDIRWDSRADAIWGVPDGEKVSFERFLSGLHPEDVAATQEAIGRSFEPDGDGKYYVEYRVIHALDGRTRWVAATGQVTFENQRPVRMVGIVQDISDRKRAEAEKQEWAERLEEQLERTRRAEEELRDANHELNEFTSVVTHDLRNPLASAMFTAELMRESIESGKSDQMPALVGSMQEVLRHMERMIQELHSQALTRRNDRVEQEIRLSDAIAEARRNNTFQLDEHGGCLFIEHELPVVRGNPVLVIQLFSNLIDNAVKYRGASPPEIRIRATCGDGCHHITVADNGPGVAEEDRERIFQSSERGRNSTATLGSGLGLAFCRRIMEMHGGTITVGEAPGGGAAFLLTFPA